MLRNVTDYETIMPRSLYFSHFVAIKQSKMASNPKGGKKKILIEFMNVTNEE